MKSSLLLPVLAAGIFLSSTALAQNAPQLRLKSYANFTYNTTTQAFDKPLDSVDYKWNGNANNTKEILRKKSSILLYSDKLNLYKTDYGELVPKNTVPQSDFLLADTQVIYKWTKPSNPALSSYYKIKNMQEVSFYPNGQVEAIATKDYDEANKVFNNATRYHFEYDGQGNRTADVYQKWSPNVSDWQNFTQHAYTYDNAGNLTEDVEQTWTGQWNNYKRTFYSYNSSNKLIEFVNQFWSAPDSLAWRSVTKTNYYYKNGLIDTMVLSMWSVANSIWRKSTKVLLDYGNNNRLVEVVKMSYGQNQLILMLREAFEYDAVGNNTSYVLQQWDTAYWRNVSKTLFEYQDTVVKASIAQNWSTADSAFRNYSKWEYKLNSALLPEQFQSYPWDGSKWDDKSGQIINFHYETYGEDTASSVNNVLASDDILLYPNPTAHQFNIRLKNASVAYIRITDGLGRVVFETKDAFSAPQVQIPTSHLSNGIYNLQIKSGNKIGSKSFVIER